MFFFQKPTFSYVYVGACYLLKCIIVLMVTRGAGVNSSLWGSSQPTGFKIEYIQ